MKDYLKPQEVADYLNVSGGLVRKLLRERQLEGVKIGSEWRISRAAMEAFIQSNTQEAVPKVDQQKVRRPLPTRIV